MELGACKKMAASSRSQMAASSRSQMAASSRSQRWLAAVVAAPQSSQPQQSVAVMLSQPLWQPRPAAKTRQAAQTSSLSPVAELQSKSLHEPSTQAPSQFASSHEPWAAFVERTASAFDESRAYGGFLKTYRPVRCDHLSKHELVARQAQLREAMSASQKLAAPPFR